MTTRAEDVLSHLGKVAGREGADTFRQCQEKGAEIQASAAVDLVRRASKLAAWLQGLNG